MEIQVNHVYVLTDLKFKIDLIVWKYDKINKINQIDNEFKIDLIVWKFNISVVIYNFKSKFKIDLIVWK